jgi:hypothetical protein
LDGVVHPGIEWLDDQAIDGVIERSFRITRPGRRVPGVLWLPQPGSAAMPLVLLGHGGSGHKRSLRSRPTSGPPGIARTSTPGHCENEPSGG